MPPKLGEIIENGPSRHRLRKGLLLVSRDIKREPSQDEQTRIVTHATKMLTGSGLSNYKVEPDTSHSSLLNIITPFVSVHTPVHRDIFFKQLSKVMHIVLNSAEANGFFSMGMGINPFIIPQEGQPTALCADIHEIEVLNDLEINRIYNLFRQYLPELIAISAHSALYGGRLQKDLSTRMRINPSSFTPPSLTLFSSKQLDRLKRDARKNYGLGDLAQLDVNLTKPDILALRFVDAQASLRFIRSQLLLFQAIAIHGRSLARQGSQMPILHNRVIKENKALAIESGPGAVFKPDSKRQVKKATAWYQDRKVAERASNALLEVLHLHTVGDSGTILHGLRMLKTDYAEISPWLLGAELRKRGEACLVNYGEYQKRLFYIARNAWPTQLQNDMQRLVKEPDTDFLYDYNKEKFSELSTQIATEWAEKLKFRRNTKKASATAQTPKTVQTPKPENNNLSKNKSAPSSQSTHTPERDNNNISENKSAISNLFKKMGF